MYPQNTFAKAQGESLFSCNDAYAGVLSLVDSLSVNFAKAVNPRVNISSVEC